MSTHKKQDLWKTTQTRALDVAEQDVELFRFDPLDIKLAQAMLSGANTVPDLAAEIGAKPIQVRDRLLDPVRCAWISKQLEKVVGDRLGQVMAAVYNRAVRSGDPQAASLLMKKYNRFKPQEHHHKHLHMDLSAYDDEMLDKLISQKERNLNIHVEKPEDEPSQ